MNFITSGSATLAAGSRKQQQQQQCQTESCPIKKKSYCKRKIWLRYGNLNAMILSSSLWLILFNLIIGQLVTAALNLPGGIENVLGFVPRSTFQCKQDGYFGDIDNDCRIFHLCQRQLNPDGRTEWRHWTYACGNQTMFNQLTLTCAFVDEAIPCKHASQFQYLNEVIHKPAEPFLTDADVTSGISYYSNRIMSDGARARAFEDSQLLAQIGGSNTIDNSLGSSNNNDNSNSNNNNNNNIELVINHNNNNNNFVQNQQQLSNHQLLQQQQQQQQHNQANTNSHHTASISHTTSFASNDIVGNSLNKENNGNSIRQLAGAADLARQSLPAFANADRNNVDSSWSNANQLVPGNFIESKLALPNEQPLQTLTAIFNNGRQDQQLHQHHHQQQQQQQHQQQHHHTTSSGHHKRRHKQHRQRHSNQVIATTAATTTTRSSVQQQQQQLPRSVGVPLQQAIAPGLQQGSAGNNLIENHSIQLEHHTTNSAISTNTDNNNNINNINQPTQFGPESSSSLPSIRDENPFATVASATSSGLSSSPSPLVSLTTATPFNQGAFAAAAASPELTNQQQQQQFVQPPSPQASNGDQQQRQQQQQQQQLVSTTSSNNEAAQPVQSFGFSLTTNHGPGVQAVEPTLQFGPLQAQPAPAMPNDLFQSQPVTASILSTSLQQQQPTTTTTTVTPFTTTVFSANNQLATTQAAVAPATTTISTFAPTFSTQRFQNNQPTTLASIAQSAPATTTVAAPTPRSDDLLQPVSLVEPRTQQPGVIRRRQQQQQQRNNSPSITRQQQPQQQRVLAQRERGRDRQLERAHSGFHSTRISAAQNVQANNRQQQQQTGRSSAGDTALVMRRDNNANSLSSTSIGSSTSATGGAGVSATSQFRFVAPEPSDWQVGYDFWRRPFDSQLLNPKFESSLTRKRV